MKLRNKKTGQVKEFEIGKLEEIFTLKDGREIADYKYFYSLAELNDEWEDYEEPKIIGDWECSYMSNDFREGVLYIG